MYCFTCASEHPADEPPQDYLNIYECDCGAYWEDVWCCGCDDECPVCFAAVSPTSSEVTD